MTTDGTRTGTDGTRTATVNETDNDTTPPHRMF